jgi:hypothetical protein
MSQILYYAFVIKITAKTLQEEAPVMSVNVVRKVEYIEG